jgi:exodeoxyribonuclease V beta subunit
MGDVPPDAITKLVEGLLRDAGLLSQEDPGRIDQALQIVKNVMQSTIPQVAPDFRFGDLRREDRNSELEFYLTAAHADSGKDPVTEEQLIDVLGRDYGRIAHDKKLSGFLNGFIDLVFRYNEKWWIVDWKSNHLGNSSEQYNSTMLEQVMRQHNYHLQYHLYTIALNRYLTVSSGGSLNYEKNFGGILYIFLRGVDGKGNGIYYGRPKFETIQKLEALL